MFSGEEDFLVIAVETLALRNFQTRLKTALSVVVENNVIDIVFFISFNLEICKNLQYPIYQKVQVLWVLLSLSNNKTKVHITWSFFKDLSIIHIH